MAQSGGGLASSAADTNHRSGGESAGHNAPAANRYTVRFESRGENVKLGLVLTRNRGKGNGISVRPISPSIELSKAIIAWKDQVQFLLGNSAKGPSLSSRDELIDAAIAADVARFCPSVQEEWQDKNWSQKICRDTLKNVLTGAIQAGDTIGSIRVQPPWRCSNYRISSEFCGMRKHDMAKTRNKEQLPSVLKLISNRNNYPIEITFLRHQQMSSTRVSLVDRDDSNPRKKRRIEGGSVDISDLPDRDIVLYPKGDEDRSAAGESGSWRPEVGRRVKVLRADNVWYCGTIARVRSGKRRERATVAITYDDGAIDEETYSGKDIMLLPEDESSKAPLGSSDDIRRRDLSQANGLDTDTAVDTSHVMTSTVRFPSPAPDPDMSFCRNQIVAAPLGLGRILAFRVDRRHIGSSNFASTVVGIYAIDMGFGVSFTPSTSVSPATKTSDFKRHSLADVSINHLPSDVLARSLEFLPYSEVLQCSAVSRKLLYDVSARIQSLCVLGSKELRVAPAARFKCVTDIRICCLTKFSAEGAGGIQVCKVASGQILPFLCSFPKLKHAFLGGSCPRVNFCLSRCLTDDDRKRHTMMIVAISGAYRSGWLSSQARIDTGGHFCALSRTFARIRPGRRCKLCPEVCSSFPREHVNRLAREHRVCVPADEIPEVIEAWG